MGLDNHTNILDYANNESNFSDDSNNFIPSNIPHNINKLVYLRNKKISPIPSILILNTTLIADTTNVPENTNGICMNLDTCGKTLIIKAGASLVAL